MNTNEAKAQAQSDVWIRELELMAPDVVLCAGTYKFVVPVMQRKGLNLETHSLLPLESDCSLRTRDISHSIWRQDDQSRLIVEPESGKTEAVLRLCLIDEAVGILKNGLAGKDANRVPLSATQPHHRRQRMLVVMMQTPSVPLRITIITITFSTVTIYNLKSRLKLFFV